MTILAQEITLTKIAKNIQVFETQSVDYTVERNGKKNYTVWYGNCCSRCGFLGNTESVDQAKRTIANHMNGK